MQIIANVANLSSNPGGIYSYVLAMKTIINRVTILTITSCMSALQPWGGYGAGGRGGNWGMARPPIQGDTRLRYKMCHVLILIYLFYDLPFSVTEMLLSAKNFFFLEN